MYYFYTLVIDLDTNGVGTILSEVAAFLSGVGNVGLFGIGLYAAGTFKRWVKERRLEKKSLVAEAALNNLDFFKVEITEWVRCSTFTQDPKQNSENPFDEINYHRSGKEISEKLIKAKNISLRFNDDGLNDVFNNLEKFTDNLFCALQAKHFEAKEDATMQEMASRLNFDSASKKINEYYSTIHKILCSKLMFE